jgi:hypothetical protein
MVFIFLLFASSNPSLWVLVGSSESEEAMRYHRGSIVEDGKPNRPTMCIKSEYRSAGAERYSAL